MLAYFFGSTWIKYKSINSSMLAVEEHKFRDICGDVILKDMFKIIKCLSIVDFTIIEIYSPISMDNLYNFIFRLGVENEMLKIPKIDMFS